MSETKMPNENLRTFKVEKFLYENTSIPAEIIYDPVRARKKQTELDERIKKKNAENKKANIKGWLILILFCTLIAIVTWATIKRTLQPIDDTVDFGLCLGATYFIELMIIGVIAAETEMVSKKTDLKSWDYYSANERFAACWRNTNVQVVEGKLWEDWQHLKLYIVAADDSGVVQEFSFYVDKVPVVKMIDFDKIRIDLAKNEIAIPFHMPSTNPPRLPR